MKKVFLFSFIGLITLSLFFIKTNQNNPETIITPTVTLAPTPQKEETVVYPTSEFNQRITKKNFAIYITPKNSPIQPERFSGYHTGVDVEYEDVLGDVPVFSVCDGEMVLSKWVSGYGGTAVIKCQDNYYIYGHLNVDSITKNPKIFKGEQIAILGQGKTKETDFERKHLHFGIHKNTLNLKGYVQHQNELQTWINPLLIINI